MLLKRIYHQDKLVRDKTGRVTEVKPGAVAGVKVMRAKAVQRFSPRVIERGAAEGWLMLGGGKIVIGGEKGVAYQIERTPGLYCCHCGKALDDSSSAQVHVATVHSGAKSPDPQNPAGYRRDNFYAGKKV